MKIHIVARHVKLTKALKSFIDEKIGKMQNHFENIIWAQIVLTVEKRVHGAEIVIHASQQTMRARADGGDLYSAVDMALDKINAQIRKYKERLKEHRLSETDSVKFMEEQNIQGETKFSVIKEIPLRAMTREEAAGEMEKLGYDFWLFMEAPDKRIKVVLPAPLGPNKPKNSP